MSFSPSRLAFSVKKILGVGAVVASTSMMLASCSSTPPASLAVEAFNAPLMGTTATAQATRFPELSEVLCSDDSCSEGLFESASSGGVEYSTRQIMRDASYTQVPEFRQGVLASWSDASVAEGAYASASFTIAEYAAGTNLETVITEISDMVGISLTKTEVDSVTVWSGEASDESDDENIYSGTNFKAVYAIQDNSIIRATCQFDAVAAKTTKCALGNMTKMVVGISKKSPSTVLPDEEKITSALPTHYPADMRPLVVISVPSQAAWGERVSSDDPLYPELANSSTAMTQFTLSGSPRMRIKANFTDIEASQNLTDFVEDGCHPTDTRDCVSEELPGSLAIQKTYFDKGTDFANAQASIIGAGNGRLLEMFCQKRVPVAGQLTEQDRVLCTETATELFALTLSPSK